MSSLLRLTALRELNLTDGLELTPGRLAQLAQLHSLHSLSLRDCYELKVRPRPSGCSSCTKPLNPQTVVS